jgi:DUF1680 family protein
MHAGKLSVALAVAVALRGAGIGYGADVSAPEGKAVPFALEDVRLLAGPFRENQERDHGLLLSMDADRLLHTFKVNAGLPSDARPLGGWEKPDVELRGHTLGHYLSALSLMYASTGDEQLKQRVDHIVAELAKCQDALAAKSSHPGYLSAFPESLFDRNDAAQRVWAPWYTMHKIMAGLLDAADLCGNRQALETVNKLAGWVKFRVDRMPSEQFQKSLQNEHGGMNEVMSNLSVALKNPDYLRVAQAFNHAAVFEPLAAGQDKLDTLHANTQIPKIIGAAREFELTGNETYRKVAETFWDAVALKRSYVIGGDSDNEHFFPVGDFGQHLSAATAETCNTYNMLKLTRHLFAWDPAGGARKMDFYERGLYNQILASQDPATGMVAYFISLQPGHFKTFSTPKNSFWCCLGTGMENHAKYGDTIYFHDDSALWVNLYIPSEVKWADKGVTVRQETAFPREDTTRLTFHAGKPTQMPVRFRVPEWAAGPVVATVNGQSVSLAEAKAGSYATIDRQWKEGDRVELKLPMDVHTEMLPNDNNTLAILYGPIVLAADLGTGGLEHVPLYAAGQGELFKVSDPAAPRLVTGVAEAMKHVTAVSGEPLTFKIKDVVPTGEVTLRPLYEISTHRYTVYFDVLTDFEWLNEAKRVAAKNAEERAKADSLVDAVRAGNPYSEKDHGLEAGQSVGADTNDVFYREAPARGAFGYAVKAADAGTLRVTYLLPARAGSAGFDVLIDGQKVAEETLADVLAVDPRARQKLGVRSYTLPDGAKGKERVNVTFAGHEDKGTARVVVVEMVRGK